MKRLKIAFLFALLLGTMSASAQPRKVLIAPAGLNEQYIATCVNAVQSTLVGVNESISVVNNDESLNKLRDIELNRQASGNINDDELARIGNEMAANQVIGIVMRADADNKTSIYAKVVDVESNVIKAGTTFPDVMEDDPQLPTLDHLNTQTIQALAPILIYRLKLYSESHEAELSGKVSKALGIIKKNQTESAPQKAEVKNENEKDNNKKNGQTTKYKAMGIEMYYGVPHIVFAGTFSADKINAAESMAANEARKYIAQAIKTSVSEVMNQQSAIDSDGFVEEVINNQWGQTSKSTILGSYPVGDAEIIKEETKKKKGEKHTIYTIRVKVGMPLDKFEKIIDGSNGEQDLYDTLEKQNISKEKVKIIVNVNNDVKNYWKQTISNLNNN